MKGQRLQTRKKTGAGARAGSLLSMRCYTGWASGTSHAAHGWKGEPGGSPGLAPWINQSVSSRTRLVVPARDQRAGRTDAAVAQTQTDSGQMD